MDDPSHLDSPRKNSCKMSMRPTGCWRTVGDVPVAQGTERLPSKQRVAGSNPAWDAKTAMIYPVSFLKRGVSEGRKPPGRAAFLMVRGQSDTLPAVTSEFRFTTPLPA